MKGILSNLLVLLVLITVLQGIKGASLLDEKLKIKRRLQVINKAPVKIFVTKYGDILDCVEINKQHAFDHPLLKNHLLQMKPEFNVSKETSTTRRPYRVLTPSQLIQESMTCPEGTVPIKRITEEDLALEKFTSSVGTSFSTRNSSKFIDSSIDSSSDNAQFASVESLINNAGASGFINVWNPEVANDQLSQSFVVVASDDGSATNFISAGWTVAPSILQNSARLYAYWTKDTGKSTGCYNVLCPGFVQVSRKVSLGLILQPVSTYNGSQYFIQVSIKQELNSKNWWLFYGDEGVGYWPKELFSTLTNGAQRAGWGGKIQSPPTEPTPAMGSGHFPEEGPTKASLIYDVTLYGATGVPKKADLQLAMTKPDCYKVYYGGDAGGSLGHYLYFGGPPNCKH